LRIAAEHYDEHQRQRLAHALHHRGSLCAMHARVGLPEPRRAPWRCCELAVAAIQTDAGRCWCSGQARLCGCQVQASRAHATQVCR
jgi:hypothetical protein